MARKIDFQVGFTIDRKDLNEIQEILQQIQQAANKKTGNSAMNNELKQAAATARELEQILNKSWNSKLNQLDLSRMNKSIKDTYGGVDQLRAKLESVGQGQVFNKMASSILNTNMQLKQSNKILDSMAQTMANTVRFGISSSVFNRITNEIQRAYDYSIKLDTSLNDIRIVSNKSADDMERFAVQANKAAKALGSSTLDYTNASTIYYQQGLSDEDVAARTEVTLKAANVTGQTGEEVSEQLTAIWNGYKVSAEEAELYIDKVAAVAAATAADLEELSTGMSKVASAANLMGIDIDQLNAMMSTMISVTRESPETIGTAMRNILARMGQLQSDGEDEFGVTLTKVTQQMSDMGIQILDENNNIRNMGTILDEVAEKWNTWSKAQQMAAAKVMAGTQNYSRFVTLMDNQDMWADALEVSRNAQGELNRENEIYLESTKAHLQQLATEAEKTYDILFNQDAVNGMTDALTGLLELFNTWMSGVGGGLRSITVLASGLANIFSTQIGKGLNQMVLNYQAEKANVDASELKENIIRNYQANGGQQTEDNYGAGLATEVGIAERLLKIKGQLSSEDYNRLTTMQQQSGAAAQQIYDAQNYKKNLEGIFKNEDVSLNTMKQRLKEIQAQTKALEQQKTTVEEIGELILNAEQGDEDDAEASWDALTDIEGERTQIAGFNAEDMNTIYNDLLNYDQDRDISWTLISQKGEAIEATLQQQYTQEEQLQEAIKQRTFLESQDYQQLLREQEARETLIRQAEQQAERQKAITATVQGITTLVSLLTSLSGIYSTMTNEDLTGWEKFSQISMTLLMTLPMLITQFDTIRTLMPNLAVSMGIVGASAKMGFRQATIAVLTFKTALGPLWLALLGVAAVIGTVVGVGYALVKAYNADADAAKEAAERSKETADAAQEAKEAYEVLKETLDGYDTAVEKMKDLTVGTEEYTEALKEANEEAMALIEANGDLAKKATRNAQGLIEFRDEDGNLIDRKQLEKQSLTSANKASAAANLAEIDSNNASLKSQRTNFIREFIDNYNNTKANPRIASSQLTESSPQILALENKLDDILKIINETGAITKDDIKAQLGNSILYQDLIDSLMETDNKKELENLANELDKNTNVNKLLLDESLRASLENNEVYAGLSESEKNAVASIYGEGLTNEKRAEIEKQARDKWYKDRAAIFGGGNEDVVHSEYARARGWTLSKDKLGDKAIYIDSEGNEHEISDDAARAYLVQRQISEQTGKYDEDTLNKMMSGIQKVSKVGAEIDSEIGTELLGFITGKDTTFDTTQITQDQIDKLKQKIQSGELLGDLQKVTSEEWAAMGVNNAEEYIAKIQEGITNFKPNWDLEYQRNAENAEQTQEILNVLSKGDESELKDKQLERLKQLESEHEALGEIQDRTSHKYLQTLREIKEQQELNTAEALKNSQKQQEEDLKTNLEKLDELKKEYDALSEDEKNNPDNKIYLELVAKTDEVEEALKKLEDTKYQIKVQIDTDLASDVEDAFGIADELTQLQNTVSDDLTYTFEEAQALIDKGYGEMFTNAKETAENTIQVNKDVMNAFIDDKQAEINADREAKIAQLENQKLYLQAQREALVNKLNALQEAASAETAVDAATAMEKVNNANSEYEAATKALNQSLQDEATGATESQNINAELFNALGGMYEQDAENENQAEADATNNQQANIEARIQNVKSLHEAYSSLATQIRESENGVNTSFSAGGTTGGVNIGITGSSTIEAGSQDAKQIDITELKNKTQELFNNNKQQYDATIKALIESTQAEINNIDAQIGAADAGIAALKSANVALDKAQKDARVGGSKGSGSEEKEKDPDKMDAIENERDRYHDVNIELKQIETELGRIQKQKDKLLGQDLIDNLNKQLNLLNKQMDKTNEKISIAKDEAGELRGKLSNKGVSFNNDGTIANYTQAYEAQLSYVNALVAKYNSMSAKEQEGFKETVEQAKKDFETFTDNMEKYDELISDTIPGLQDEIQDAIDQQIEIQIEKFNMEIEIRLNLKEAELEWNEFKKKIIDGIKDDNILGNANARLQDYNAYYKNDNTGIIQRNTEHINAIRNELLEMDRTGWSEVYGDNRAQALEDLQTYYQQMMKDLQEIEEIQEDIHDSYLDMIDEAQEGFDKQLETYEQISSLIEHDMKLIELVYGEENYEAQANYYQKQDENYRKQLEFQRVQKDFWWEQMQAMEEGSEEWEAARENWMSAVDDWKSSLNDAIENITDKYLNAINLIFQKLNDEVTSGKGLDYVSEQWELINQNADQYLDTINSMYGIQELENKYLDAIDQTDSISAQRKLNDLMKEEVAALEKKDKLTQYDIDRANMKYEIALKQIALEEAQQNKSTMRLRRDSQGNYSYQFVSDEDSIAKTREELQALYNELYNFDLSAYRDNLDQLLSVWTEYQEKMAEAAQINDPVKRAEKEALIQEQYGQLINGIVAENEVVRTNLHESAFTELADLYNVDVENFQNMTDAEKEILMSDMIPQWTSGVQQMADVFADEDEGFVGVCKKAMEDLADTTEEYMSDLEDLEDIAGVTYDEITEGTDDTIDKTETLLEDNQELIDKYGEQLEAIRKIIIELNSLISKYNSAKQAAMEATEAAYKYWQEQKRQEAEAAAKEQAKSTSNNNNNNSNNSSSSSGRSGTGSSGDGVPRVGDICTYIGGTYYYDSYGTSPSGNRGPGKQVTITQVKTDGRPYPIHVQSSNSAYGWLKKEQLSGYDTGGYTGNWGDNSGRLALLHQKELVLNADDTPNLLKAVSIMRNITDSIGSNILAQMAGVKAPTGQVAASTDTIEQIVQIDANFPNVQSSDEIKTAINDLVSRAAQRVHRKR